LFWPSTISTLSLSWGWVSAPSTGAIAKEPRAAHERESITKIRMGASLLAHEGGASESGGLIKTEIKNY
jgi:hypothetical protein